MVLAEGGWQQWWWWWWGVNRQKGLRRTRTDQTMVTQFRKTPHDSGRCLLILITLHYVSHSLILQKTKTLVVGGVYFNTGLPQDPFRVYRRGRVGRPWQLRNFVAAWPASLQVVLVFRRKFYVCQFLELQSTKILVVEGKNAFAYDSRLKTRAPFNMWLRCVKFCFWLAPIRSGRSRHFPFFLQKFANSGCTN